MSEKVVLTFTNVCGVKDYFFGGICYGIKKSCSIGHLLVRVRRKRSDGVSPDYDEL